MENPSLSLRAGEEPARRGLASRGRRGPQLSLQLVETKFSSNRNKPPFLSPSRFLFDTFITTAKNQSVPPPPSTPFGLSLECCATGGEIKKNREEKKNNIVGLKRDGRNHGGSQGCSGPSSAGANLQPPKSHRQ